MSFLPFYYALITETLLFYVIMMVYKRVHYNVDIMMLVGDQWGKTHGFGRVFFSKKSPEKYIYEAHYEYHPCRNDIVRCISFGIFALCSVFSINNYEVTMYKNVML